MMEEGFFIALGNFLRLMYLFTSPIIFLVGILLLRDINTYLRIEKFLGRSYCIFKKTPVNQLERNRESLQLFLLKWRKIVGVACLVNSLVAIYIVLLLSRILRASNNLI